MRRCGLLCLAALVSQASASQTPLIYPTTPAWHLKPPTRPSNVCLPGEHLLRVLYYSRHSGTYNNFHYFYQHYKDRLQVTRRNPKDDVGLGMNADRANDFIHNGLVETLCRQYDVIVICDTIPDARGFMQAGQEALKLWGCRTVLEVTNRFDYLVRDYAAYNGLMASVADSMRDTVQWVVNNPWELIHMARRGVHVQDSASLILPFGYSDIPEDPKLKPQPYCVFTERSPFDYKLPGIFNQHHVPILRLPERYGGPRALAKYRCWVHIPYQVSIMKVFENLAAGVLMLIPSHTFFEQLVNEHSEIVDAAAPILDRVEEPDFDWRHYLDFYREPLASFFYHFDSFEQLRELLMDPDSFSDRDVRLEQQKEFMAFARTESLRRWHQVLFQPATTT